MGAELEALSCLRAGFARLQIVGACPAVFGPWTGDWIDLESALEAGSEDSWSARRLALKNTYKQELGREPALRTKNQEKPAARNGLWGSLKTLLLLGSRVPHSFAFFCE